MHLTTEKEVKFIAAQIMQIYKNTPFMHSTPAKEQNSNSAKLFARKST